MVIDKFTGSVKGLCRNQNGRAAKDLLNEMLTYGLKADVITYNILIDGCCKDNESSKAEKLLGEMLNVGVEPNHITYNTLMDGYCMEGNVKAALKVMTQMEKEREVGKCCYYYNVPIKGFCRWLHKLIA
ncbi:pentatricopeptide repeat-containing protein At1g09820-like [Vigna radiata var. radiata]|uniref:Pentatricopeptide repeat-containing protein At1g09820-like n=1 Tax=Vigna radiata var. radiata TaxID=3916 RepID=A0A3Q0FGE4_VIGRR|nr:pentatricopeptide repeat-containing protein At1g09820-like [Vigna radiata var. radiata]XP_022643136.1 pentatricopeptide repeat-containing protein At1g09820-like [Vigna radiata var. radiata]